MHDSENILYVKVEVPWCKPPDYVMDISLINIKAHQAFSYLGYNPLNHYLTAEQVFWDLLACVNKVSIDSDTIWNGEQRHASGYHQAYLKWNHYIDNGLMWHVTTFTRLCKMMAVYINGLMQERRNSSALALELRLSCINPSICICFLYKNHIRLQ